MAILGPGQIELLAPAGTAAIGRAAVNCGADAVYIGAERFGAREKAGNSIADISRLCDYAHKFWARVYVTLNTILTDAELPAARKLIGELYDAGIDGLIIQDPGLLELDLPPVPLIASTQMHNHSPERVAFLEQVGFQRAILARELSLDAIAEIRGRTKIELECFVFGALCVGYSGRCWLSYAIGGRSANRGACAQPCRRPYSLSDGSGTLLARDTHLLCLKDLNLSGHLAHLLDTGISSFKIEGRLKDHSYVANAVGYFRKALDAVLSERGLGRSASGTVALDFAPDPARTFNRGFTDYFIQGRKPGVASLNTPKSLGKEMGTVARAGRDFFVLAGPHEGFSPGDGICFWDAAGRLAGTTVHRVENDRVFPDKPDKPDKSDKPDAILPGMVIFRNHDHQFQRQVNASRAHRKIAIRLTLSETQDGFEVFAEDEDGNRAGFGLPLEKTPAQNPEMAQKTIEVQLSRLGDTEFACRTFEIGTDKMYFIPARVLNEMRRGVVDRLTAARRQNRPKPSGKIEKNAAPAPDTRLTYQANILNRKAADFYRRHGVEIMEPALEAMSAPDRERGGLSGKPVMVSKYCILHELGRCRKTAGAKDLRDPLILTDAAGRRFRITTDCSRCEMEIYVV